MKNPLAVAVEKALDVVPDALLPYQQRWCADDSPLKVAEKSRRIGLTWAEASDNVLIAASNRDAGGMNVYYIGYSMDMAVEYIEACGMWAKVVNAVASEIEEGTEIFDSDDGEKEIKTYIIRFPKSGFRIVALSSRPTNLRGKQGVVVIDEAAFHDKLGELVKAAIAHLLWGGKVRIISTHNGDENPFNELIQEIRSGKRAGAVHRITFREAVDEGLYHRVCLRRGIAWTQAGEDAWVAQAYKFYGVDADEELDVIPKSGEGAYLPRAWIEAAQTVDASVVVRWAEKNEFAMLPESQRFAACRAFCREELLPRLATLAPDLKKFHGGDFARSGDLSVLWPIVERTDLRLETPLVVELRNIPYEQQRQVLVFMVEHLARWVSGAHDARGNGGYLAEAAAQRFGASRVAQVQITEGWYRENMPRLRQAFEDRMIAIPKDSDLLDDLRAIRKVKGVAKVPDNAKTRGTDGGERHGDAAIALVMALFARATMDISPIDYASVGSRTGLDAGDAALGDSGFGSVGGMNDFGGFL